MQLCKTGIAARLALTASACASRISTPRSVPHSAVPRPRTCLRKRLPNQQAHHHHQPRHPGRSAAAASMRRHGVEAVALLRVWGRVGCCRSGVGGSQRLQPRVEAPSMLLRPLRRRWRFLELLRRRWRLLQD